MVRKMAPQTALIACALFCDWSLEQVDGDPRDFCLVSARDGDKLVAYTTNLANGNQLKAAEMLMSAARRMIDKHCRARAHGG
jgi:hypothetical protein